MPLSMAEGTWLASRQNTPALEKAPQPTENEFVAVHFGRQAEQRMLSQSSAARSEYRQGLDASGVRGESGKLLTTQTPRDLAMNPIRTSWLTRSKNFSRSMSTTMA